MMRFCTLGGNFVQILSLSLLNLLSFSYKTALPCGEEESINLLILIGLYTLALWHPW